MDQTVITAFINNAALLLALSIILNLSHLQPLRYRKRLPYTIGITVALLCVAIMKLAFELRPGIVYDTRSILISVTALLFGTIPVTIAAVTAIAVRAAAGGAGTVTGITVIVTSALIGLAWRRWLSPYKSKLRWLNVYLMGLAVHAAMIADTFLLPYPNNLAVIGTIAMPVMLIYPLASAALCLLLMRQKEYMDMQGQLKQSEERFRYLFEEAPLGYQSLDIDGNVIQVNQQWCNLLGYAQDEVTGKWFGSFLSPEGREAFQLRFPVFKAQGFIHSELEMLHKDGTPLYIAFEGRIGYGPDGAFRQTHCILQDITKQKRAEDELRVSEEKYRRLHETMAMGVVYQAKDGSIISANPAAERILGLTFDQMQGRTSMDPRWKSIHEDGTDMPGEEHPAMVALRTKSQVGPVKMGIFQPQINSHVWLTITAVPLFHPGEDEPFQVYATFLDITAEQIANRNYKLLFQEMVDAFALHEIICDSSGKPVDYRFLTVNPAFERMTGLRSADVVGRTVLDILPDTEQYWIDKYGMVALTGESIRFEHYTATSGKHFEVSAYRPAPGQFACTFSDITKRVQAEEETKRIFSRMKCLFDYTPSPIIMFNDKIQVIEASAVARKAMGLPEQGICALNTVRQPPPEVAENIRRIISRPPDDNRYIESLDKVDMDGNIRYFESRMFPIHAPYESEPLYGYLAVDVTERINAENALKASEEKYSSYIRNAPFGVFVVNENGHYVEANAAAALVTGYSIDELTKMTIRDITAEETMESALYYFSKLKSTGSMSAELKFVHRDGSVRWWTVDAVKLSDDRYLGFSGDITEKKRAEEELLYLSYHDSHTGVYNRRYFSEELKRVDAGDYMPLSIIIGDINGVKLVNDAMGHAEGDRLIAECAKIISACCRDTDALCRTGGDEFSILLPKTDNAEAKDIMKKIQDALIQFDEDNPNGRYLHSVSLGFGTKRAVEEDVRQIIKIAEEYMYQRKLLEHNSSHSAIISSIKATMAEKSQETEAHAERLVSLTRYIAIGLRLPQNDRDKLELLATLHDIGKIGISDRILNKQGKLTEEEWVEMRRHPEIGYRIAMSTPELMPIAEYILCHHERWDGGGYPQGLSSERIPLVSRILAVADAYDAMTQDRPYRKAMSHEEALAEIQRNAGKQFDPRVVEIFVKKFN